MKERAILVTIKWDTLRRDSTIEEAAKELEELVASAGPGVIESLIFRQKNPNAPFLLDKGKVGQVVQIAAEKEADVVIFESSLSSTQQRNLEEILQTKTIDRTQLILDIFALRAKSTEGKLQVELAQLKYLLPRLSGKGIYLSRLGGGIGTRGPGEQKLEMDRRRIRERIVRLSRELENLQKRRLASITRKVKKKFPLVALGGYTNAGKSSLFNALTGAGVLVKGKLFSTLDTTTRLLALPGNRKALMVDTVGFLRELPHHLVESFKATLEEVVHADILLHVMDATRPDLAILETAVKKVFEELGIREKKTILVLNKIDLLRESDRARLMEFGPQALARGTSAGAVEHPVLSGPHEDWCAVSAKTGEGLEILKKKLAEYLGSSRHEVELFIPRESLGLADFLYREGEVLDRKDEAGGSFFRGNLSSPAKMIFKSKLKKMHLNPLDNN